MIVTHIASFLRYDSVSDPGSGFTGPFSTTTEYIVAGFFVPGDGGGGTFIWIEPSVGTPWPAEDRGIILYNTNNTNGYFKRIYSGPINVRWFGAIMGGYDPNPPIYLPEDPLIYTGYSSYTRFYSALSRNYRWRAYARR